MANPAARSDAARQSRGGEHPPSGARECVPRALPVGEIFAVLALALLFFGPTKLPALGASGVRRSAASSVASPAQISRRKTQPCCRRTRNDTRRRVDRFPGRVRDLPGRHGRR